MSTELQRVDLARDAYQTLRSLIVRGNVAPGSRMIEAEVATRLGISRTPVRSALHRLQQEGYIVEADGVQSRARARLTIAPLTRDDAAELFHIVGEIEALAGWYAAQLDPVRRGQLVAQLRTINLDLSRVAEAARPDGNTIFDLDDTFHATSVEAASRPRLRALHGAIKPQAERYVRVYISALLDEIATSVKEHDDIIRAIEAGKPGAAQQAVETNWRNAVLRLGRVIDSVGERGSW